MTAITAAVMPAFQVGAAWNQSLQDLEVALVFRRDTKQWFFLSLIQCSDVATWVRAEFAMTNAQRKTFLDVSHDKHGHFDVAYFARVESGSSCNLMRTLQPPDFRVSCHRHEHEQG